MANIVLLMKESKVLKANFESDLEEMIQIHKKRGWSLVYRIEKDGIHEAGIEKTEN